LQRKAAVSESETLTALEYINDLGAGAQQVEAEFDVTIRSKDFARLAGAAADYAESGKKIDFVYDGFLVSMLKTLKGKQAAAAAVFSVYGLSEADLEPYVMDTWVESQGVQGDEVKFWDSLAITDVLQIIAEDFGLSQNFTVQDVESLL